MLDTFKKFLFGKLDNQLVQAHANDILQNEAFIIAKEALQNDILEKWGDTPLTDTVTREQLYLQYKAVGDVCYELKRLTTSYDQPNDRESN